MESIIIDITVTFDYTTPEQKRISWKPRDYNPETDPYKDIPLPEIMMQTPSILLPKITSSARYISRQEFYGEKQ
jgi:hypothetical protein